MKNKALKSIFAAAVVAMMLAGCGKVNVSVNGDSLEDFVAQQEETASDADETSDEESDDASASESEGDANDEGTSSDAQNEADDASVADDEAGVVGLYRYDYESPYEDQEGVIFTNWIYLMPNHYGMMDIQDYSYFTWEDDGTIEYLNDATDAKFEYNEETNSITVTTDEGNDAYTEEYVRHEGNVITPGTFVGDDFSTDDGIFPASFYGDEITGHKDNYSLRVRLYSEDVFDIIDVHNLAVGDVIVVDNCIVEVKTLEEKEGKIFINEDTEGITNITLKTEGDSNGFTAEGLFGRAVTDLGVVMVKASDDLVYTYMEDGEHVYRGKDAFYQLKDAYGTQYTTEIMIEDGIITQIITDAQ